MNSPVNQEHLLGATVRDVVAPRDDPLWYKDAVIYQLHVKAFRDSNGDGIGDFKGLTESLDYIKDLGVNTVWLLPFYPSPLKDDGYDIADYHGVHPSYGTMADFRQFVREAHRRELRIMTELVINHTSDQHPWFQAARHAPPGSSKRDYYVWSDKADKWPETRIIFTDTETSNWAWDPVAKAYYWHRFFSHQPDLNFANPHVLKAVLKVMRYWFDMGVDAMRLDAIPYLCERDGTNNENLPETHEVLKKIRAELDKHYKNRFLLAECNQWPEDVREYFGDGDECHMAYHFPVMPRIYMAIAEEDRFPITDIMAQTPDIPDNCQWAIFLRNHDELTLEMVTQRERDYMYKTYATDKRMRINVGIRRRLAPLMENNRLRMELINSLLMSLIGSPIMYYGDEIGMGDNIYLGDRNGVRTPMQWSSDRNAGFSRADPQLLFSPPVMDPLYGYQAVNVEAQQRSPYSLLNWTKRLIAVRNANPAFGRGKLRFLDPGNRKILAYIREYRDEHGNDDLILCVANLSRSSQPVELNLKEFNRRIPVELMGNTPFPPIGDLPYLLTLPAWGFYWFRLSTKASFPEWHSERPVPMEFPVLVIPEGLLAALIGSTQSSTGGGGKLRTLTQQRVRQQLEQDILPRFLARQRWFSGKGRTVAGMELLRQDEWKLSDSHTLMALVRVKFTDGEVQDYGLPLALAWEQKGLEQMSSLLHCTVARVRQHAEMGILYDALWDDDYCRSLLAAMAAGESRPLPGDGQLVATGTSLLASALPASEGEGAGNALPVHHPAFEQSNTMVLFADKLVLKAYRRLRPGVHPEIEMGRFLTEASPFPHIAPLAGSLEYRDGSGEVTALAVVHGLVENQGSVWNYTVEHLGRFLELMLRDVPSGGGAMAGVPLLDAASPGAGEFGPQGSFAKRTATLARRTAELHHALAKTTGDPAFDPEPIADADIHAWMDKVLDDAERTLDQLERLRSGLPETVLPQAELLLASRETVSEHIRALAPGRVQAAKTRYHGDYHLGQVLLTQNDFIIIDFEGEPSRPLPERRIKHSPLRDVAGMLRSFNYAAAVALDKATTERPQDREKLAPSLASWRQDMTSIFAREYRKAAHGCPSYPADEDTAQRLLDLFIVEKSLYELRYELDNRPDWTRIPLAGILEMVLSRTD